MNCRGTGSFFYFTQVFTQRKRRGAEKAERNQNAATSAPALPLRENLLHHPLRETVLRVKPP